MTAQEKHKLLSMLEEVQTSTRQDVIDMDEGKVSSGEMFGMQAAGICALAMAIKSIIKDEVTL